MEPDDLASLVEGLKPTNRDVSNALGLVLLVVKNNPQRPPAEILARPDVVGTLHHPRLGGGRTGPCGGGRPPDSIKRPERLDIYRSITVLAETVSGYYSTELIRGPREQRPCKTVDDVELATLGWVHRHNHDRLPGYLDEVPPAEFEEAFCATNRTDPTLVEIQLPEPPSDPWRLRGSTTQTSRHQPGWSTEVPTRGVVVRSREVTEVWSVDDDDDQ